jgi:hypothetical protein
LNELVHLLGIEVHMTRFRRLPPNCSQFVQAAIHHYGEVRRVQIAAKEPKWPRFEKGLAERSDRWNRAKLAWVIAVQAEYHAVHQREKSLSALQLVWRPSIHEKAELLLLDAVAREFANDGVWV